MEKIVYDIISSQSKKRLVLILVLLFLFGSVMMIPTKLVLAKMLPGKSANTFSIYIDTPTNSSIEQTKKVTECVVEHLKKEKIVTDMEVFLGQGAPLDYAGLVKGSALKALENQAEIVVNLTPKESRDEASFSMVHRVRHIIQADCEQKIAGSGIKFIEMPSGPPTLATIVANIYGDDLDLMRKTSKRVEALLKETKGLVDVDVMEDDIHTKYELQPDVEKVIRSDLSVEQVNGILYLAFEGQQISVKNSQKQQDQIPIFMRLDDESRTIKVDTKEGLELKLSALKLMNPKGVMVPLKEVVKIVEIKSSPAIFRKNLKNLITVSAECDLVSQVYPLLDSRDAMIEKFSDEFEVSKVDGMSTYMFDLNLIHKESGEKLLIRWDGEMKVSLDTFRDLGGAFIAALILMFLLMVVYYKSFALSGIVLVGSFLSIIGVIIGHYITDKIQLAYNGTNFFLTATSLIGFISLMGISARSSLLLIDFTKALIASGIDKKRAIAIATSTRAKPILLTAIAIILGSLLLATDPIFGGLGIALIFGSIASTVVSLFFVPVLMDNTEAVCPINSTDEDCSHGLNAENIDVSKIG